MLPELLRLQQSTCAWAQGRRVIKVNMAVFPFIKKSTKIQPIGVSAASAL
jgi:hypothetical protein